MKRHTARSPLASLPLLADAPDAVLARLETLMTPVRVRAGEVLVREGARNRQFVLLQEGTLRVTKGGRQVAELGAGDFVGELSLLGDGTAAATVRTATDAVVWVSTSAEFDGVLHSTLGAAIEAAAQDRRAA
jgi:CRP-like cAMP-binding protein